MYTIAVALCAASTAHGQPAFFSAPVSYNPHPAVVRVVAPERDGIAYGSGALVASNETFGLVVTNWHVVRDAVGQIGVIFPDGFQSAATVLRTDRDWDLAALVVWRPNAQPIPVSNQAPRLGETLTIAGYGSGSYRAVTGRCTQYVSPGGNQPFEMVELDAPARDGDSGGPILNGRGELAGVLFGSAFGRTTGSYCGRLRWFLDSVDGDFQRLSSQTQLARQQPRQQPVVAAIPTVGPTSVTTEARQAVAGEVSPYSTRLSPVPASVGPVSPVPASTVPASPSTTDQVKTILAAIGVIALLYHALRLLGAAVG